MAKNDTVVANSDLKINDSNRVAPENEVKSKTTPNLREETRTDNNQFFEKDYLIKLDDSSDVPQEIKDRQLIDVRQSALHRGLRPTAQATLEKTVVVDEHNVRLIYKVPVEGAWQDDLDPEVEHAPAAATNAPEDIAEATKAPTAEQSGAPKESDK